MEISDDVIDRALTAYDEFLGSDDEADYEAMRAALQAAIPLVVEGLVGPEKEAHWYCTEEQEFRVYGYNACRNDILAKVKK